MSAANLHVVDPAEPSPFKAEPSLADRIAAHMRDRDAMAREQAQALIAAVEAVTILAGDVATADGIHKVGVREIAHQLARFNRGACLNLQSLMERT